ncbi:phage antirepressor KilAC domain-containing protein, partial [Turicibacter sanguinis]
KSSTLISVAELSNLMSQNGVEMGRNRLFDWLRVNGYLVKQKGPRRNLPTQRAIDLGILKMVEDPAKDYHGNPVINKTTMVTPKGQQYFLNKFLLAEKKGA